MSISKQYSLIYFKGNGYTVYCLFRTNGIASVGSNSRKKAQILVLHLLSLQALPLKISHLCHNCCFRQYNIVHLFPSMSGYLQCPGLQAVSYTHLDVYKRQPFKCRSGNIIIFPHSYNTWICIETGQNRIFYQHGFLLPFLLTQTSHTDKVCCTLKIQYFNQ